MKNYDKRMSGIISRDECARSFVKSNVHFSLNHQIALDICKVYANNPDNVDYMRFTNNTFDNVGLVLNHVNKNNVSNIL